MRITLEVLKTVVADLARGSKLLDMLNRQVDEMSGQLERLVRDPGSFRGG